MKNRKKVLFLAVFAALLLVLSGSMIYGIAEVNANTENDGSLNEDIRDGYSIDDETAPFGGDIFAL
ncbi:MAG: hypothetical protein FWD58_05700 [Firmicutes bacterium]|nr:hypothetical protein [Bacillota bacterium]